MRGRDLLEEGTVRVEIVGVEVDVLDGLRAGFAQRRAFRRQVRAWTRGQHDLARATLGQALRHGRTDFAAPAEHQHRSAHAAQSASRRARPRAAPGKVLSAAGTGPLPHVVQTICTM